MKKKIYILFWDNNITEGQTPGKTSIAPTFSKRGHKKLDNMQICNNHMPFHNDPKTLLYIYKPCHGETNVMVSDLVRHKPGCSTATEDSQRPEISD